MSPREDADGSAVPRETQRVANRSAARVRGDPRLRALRPMPRARRRFTSLGQTVARRLVVGRAGPVDARRARPNADITTWATPARGRPGAYATHPDRRVSPPTAAPRYPASHVRPPAPVGGVALGERRVHPVRPSSPWARGGTTPRRAVQVSPWTAVAADSRDSVARPRSAEEGAALPAARVRRRAQDRPAPPRAAPSAARRPHPGSDRSLRGVSSPSTAGSAVAKEAATHRGGRAARPHRETIGRAAPGGRRRTALRFEPLGAPAPHRRTDGMGRDRRPVAARRSRLGAGLARPLRGPDPAGLPGVQSRTDDGAPDDSSAGSRAPGSLSGRTPPE